MRRLVIQIAVLVAVLATVVLAGSKDDWKNRTIYQLLTDRFARTDGSTSGCGDISKYCGGSFKGIENHLDYIQGMGFDAIWISPIITNTDGGYHGYWAKDLYTINSNFGTADELKSLVQTAHQKGIWVMVDVVGNHMGPIGTDFSQLNPFNSSDHYHDWCDINGDDFQHNQWRVENCRLAQLPDLKQENDYVRSTLKSWIQGLQQAYDIDGFRVDTAPEVPKDFWTEFTQASGVFTIGECFDGRYDYVAGYQGPLSAVLNYPFYFQVRNQFAYGNSQYNWRGHYTNMAQFQDQDALGLFVGNHDNTRFLNQNGNHNRLKNAVVFTLFSVGIPIFYYGDEQGFAGGNDPQNRETLWTSMDPSSDLYKFTATAVNARKQYKVWANQQIERYVDDNFYAFTRGQVFVATSNTDNDLQRTITYHPYAEGTVLCNIFKTSDCSTVQGGKFNIDLSGGEVKVLAPQSSLRLRKEIQA